MYRQLTINKQQRTPEAVTMAKPIGATPVLTGKNADVFCNDLVSPNYSEKERKLFAELKELEDSLSK